MKNFGEHGRDATEPPAPLHGGHQDNGDTRNEDWAGQGSDLFHSYENGQNEALPLDLSERGIPCKTNYKADNERLPAASPAEPRVVHKPEGRHFQADFRPQKQTGSCLSEETRKIVQMLSNDKTYKIDRPSLGLKDRLQSLVQRSAGKRTSYVKGPRVCSTLVKMVVKRTQDSLYLRRNSFQGYCKNQEDRPPLPTFNTPIQSYIKPPKHSKVSGSDNSSSSRGNQVNISSGFEMIKRREKTTDNAQNKGIDSRAPTAVSIAPNTMTNGSHATSSTTSHLLTTTKDATAALHLATTTGAPHVTTTTASPHVIVQHTPWNHQDTHMEEQTTDNTHLGGENTHVGRTGDLIQGLHDDLRQNLIDVELKISVPYRSQDQDTPIGDHRPSFPDILAKNAYDDDDDYDEYVDDSPTTDEMKITLGDNDSFTLVDDSSATDEMKITLENSSSDVEHYEMKRPKVKEISIIPKDYQDIQNATSVKVTNGCTEQTGLPLLTNGDKMLLPSLQRGSTESNGATDLRKHIQSLNKVSLKFGTKNKKHEGEDTTASMQGASTVSPLQQTTRLATRPSTRDSNEEASRVTGKGNRGCTSSSSSNGGSGFCMATALENLSLPVYKGGGAMLRRLSDTPPASALNQSALHIDTLMRLKTDNLVARHGGKKTHIQPYPASPRQTTPAPPNDTSDQEDTPESIPEEGNTGCQQEVLESLPPIPPNVQKASNHQTQSRNASLEHPCLGSRRGSHHGQWPGSRRGSRRPSFSQDTLRKCLMAAVDHCYSTEWQETCDEVVKKEDLSQEELDKSMVKAVSRHDAERVRVLLRQGADPNVKCGNTAALLRAAKEGALYVMQALLTAGADVDARTDMGNSPLHLAARGGYSEVVVQLVHSGAFVDAINRSGVTPLQMALAHGHLEVIYSLVNLNADMFLQNKVGESAYEVAKELGYTGLSGTPQEIRRDSGVGTRVELPSTDIPVAVRMIQGIEVGCVGTVDDCLREGASPNTLLPLALHWPARASALHRAAHLGHDLIVRLLLAAGATVNIRDVVGNTPLHVAAQAGYNRIVKILLECGATRDAASQSGMTPLHRAASKGKELTCNLLTRRGGNRQAEDSSGRTPADWARKRGFKHLSQKLMYRRKSSNTLLTEGEEKQCLEHLHRLHEVALKAANLSLDAMDCEE